jgi:hypothetical protein
MAVLYTSGSQALEVGCEFSVDLRQALALNSCSGCHSVAETSTKAHHLKGRKRGENSKLSPFLTGGPDYGEPTAGYLEQPDPSTCRQNSTMRNFNDLLRRQQYMETVVGLNPMSRDWGTRLEHFLIYSAH